MQTIARLRLGQRFAAASPTMGRRPESGSQINRINGGTVRANPGRQKTARRPARKETIREPIPAMGERRSRLWIPGSYQPSRSTNSGEGS